MFALGLWLILVDVDEDMFRTLRQLQTSIVGGNSPNPSYSSLSQHGQMRAQDSQLESDFSSFLGTLTPENVFTVVVDVNPHVRLLPRALATLNASSAQDDGLMERRRTGADRQPPHRALAHHIEQRQTCLLKVHIRLSAATSGPAYPSSRQPNTQREHTPPCNSNITRATDDPLSRQIPAAAPLGMWTLPSCPPWPSPRGPQRLSLCLSCRAQRR
jgi:hypothetical protein